MDQDTVPPAFRLPAALRHRGYGLRPETEADMPFLLDLFATMRAQEMALVPWDETQRRMFLAQQFSAQHHHYRNALTGCAFHIIVRGDAPVGRLYLQERDTQLHIVDIALLPEETGQGIGSAILHALADNAAARGKGLCIFVERNNPALKLYRRLGFTEVRATDIYLEMERPPEMAVMPVS